MELLTGASKFVCVDNKLRTDFKAGVNYLVALLLQRAATIGQGA
jgi:hypothetical protein|tara:strand:- start:850 stop:981 length:132 start_codon:yes stop_codon:yes gene_type:complete